MTMDGSSTRPDRASARRTVGGRRRAPRTVAGAATCLILAGVVCWSVSGTALAADLSPVSSRVTPRCRAAGLAVSVLPDTAARTHRPGMNHHGLTLALTNTGHRACAVDGYLGLGVYDTRGRLVAGHALRGGSEYTTDPGPRRVLLAPRHAAYADLAWTSAAYPYHSRVTLRVIAPNDTVQVRQRVTLGSYSGSVTETALTAHPLPIPN